MIRKSITELHFVDSRSPMATVEIDIDSLPEGTYGYESLVQSALAPLAAANPDLKATVYVYQGQSVNFGEYGYSAFFGVAGSRLPLPALHAIFSGVAGLKLRYSDSIVQSQALRQYHVEGGHIWMPEEEGVWYCEADEEDGSADDELSEPKDDPDGHENDSESGSEEAGGASGARVQIPVRFRAARSDASVGSIARNIEEVYGLPEGAVALRGPDKRPLRSDATVRTLRKRWE